MIIIGFSIFLSLLLTPLTKNIALFLKIVDKPNIQDHKTHDDVIPLMGGVAMCSTWIITLLMGMLAPYFFIDQNFPTDIGQNLIGVFAVCPRLIAILIGALLITILGLIDDKYILSAKMKFSGQLIIAMFVVTFGGIKISLFIHNYLINWLITVAWIVTIINAINFFDNMDGLAVGVAAIAFSFFTITAIIYHHYFVACIGAAGIGTALGFWFYNHTPASIFMGDSGSHFLGYTLAVTGALTTYYQTGISITRLSVLIPLFILAVPLFDLLSVIIIRLKIKKPIYVGDNNHISHRFTKMGMSRKKAVLCVHLLTIIIGLSVLPLLWEDLITGIVCFIQACIILILISVLQSHSITNHQNNH